MEARSAVPAPPGSLLSRDTIIAALTAALEPLPEVIAGYLGGSDATGRTDRWSDIDYQAIVEDDAIELAISTVLAALAALSPIAVSHRLPEPTWHGCSQVFVRLANADPAHFVDFAPMKRSHTDRFLEVERHGTPVVLFDKEGLVHLDPFDRAAHLARMEARLGRIRETFPLFQTLVTRAVHRGFTAEAGSAYRSHALHPLVEILRMRHCPDRYDFGVRYLDSDLPADVRARVEALALPASLDAIEEYRAQAEVLFFETLRELDAERATRE